MAVVHTRDIQARFAALITQTQASDLDVILRQLLGETPHAVRRRPMVL